MSLEPNPYLTPATFAAPPALPVDSEVVRRQHLNHEASVKSVGTLYLLGGVVMAISGIGFITIPNKEYGISVAIFMVALGALQFILGYAIRRLQKTARIVAAVLAAPGLIGFPIGTLISALVLYLMLSRKGAMVFSDDYKRIIAETPHIKYKTSIIVWIVLGLFALVVLAGLVLAALSTFTPRH
jgi:hypothetical protein